MLRLALTSIVVVGLAAPALAQEARRQLDAHSHGEGRLAIAIDGTRVEMELEAPAHDLVGFEHAPSNAKQRAAIADAKKRLAKLSDVLVLPKDAGCKLTSAKVEVIGAAAGKGKGHSHSHSHGHSHSHSHNHGNAQKAEAKPADGKEAAKNKKADAHDAHSEFKAVYALECASPAKLASITFDYFKHFKGAEKLAVTVIGPKGQSSFAVTRAKPVLDLAGLS
jgi:hypothetical protein